MRRKSEIFSDRNFLNCWYISLPEVYELPRSILSRCYRRMSASLPRFSLWVNLWVEMINGPVGPVLYDVLAEAVSAMEVSMTFQVCILSI